MVFLTDENTLHNEWEKYKATRAERWNHTSARAKDWHRVANGEQLTVAERWELESAGRRAALSGHIPSSVEHMDAQHQFAFYNGYGARNAENTLGNIASYVDGVGLLKTALFAIKTAVTHPTLVTTLIGKTIGGVKTAGTFFAKNVKISEDIEALASKAVSYVKLAQEEFSATSPNAAEALNSKLSAIQKAQANAAKVEKMPDGSIRYYLAETPSRDPGVTRGASYVTEHNPNNGTVRSWMESYDHLGNVNRIHPKMYNGQTLQSPHFPPTANEILNAEYFSKLPF